MSLELPTSIQRAALQQASGRSRGTPWRGPRAAAERCCELGWLEESHLPGPDGVVYVLTPAGQAALLRSEPPVLS